MTKLKQENPEVYYAQEWPLKVSAKDIDALKGKMALAGRGRIRLCAHRDSSDSLHEMFIVVSRGNYVRPHKHLSKSESLQVLEGSADAVFFDEKGEIKEVVRMGDYRSGLKFYYRMTTPAFHTLVLRSDFLVFKEVADGPFKKADTVFPNWAPEDGETPEARQYMKKLSDRVDRFL